MIQNLTLEQNKALPGFCAKVEAAAVNVNPVHIFELTGALAKLYNNFNFPAPDVELVKEPTSSEVGDAAPIFIKSIHHARGMVLSKMSEHVWKAILHGLQSDLRENLYSLAPFDFILDDELAALRFCHDHMGMKEETVAVHPLFDVFRHAYGVRLFKGKVQVLENPASVKVKGSKIHGDQKPAIRWRSGADQYVLNGVVVPKELALPSAGSVVVGPIFNNCSYEVLNQLIEKVGLDVLVSKVGGEVLDEQGDLKLTEMRRKIVVGGEEDYEVVKVVSGGRLFITHNNHLTVDECLDWHFHVGGRFSEDGALYFETTDGKIMIQPTALRLRRRPFRLDIVAGNRETVDVPTQYIDGTVALGGTYEVFEPRSL